MNTDSVSTQLLEKSQMTEAEKRKRWDELRSAWGERLLQQYPSGLPFKPDFRIDHLACSNWVTEALSVYTPQAMVWDLPPLHVTGGKNYPDFMNLTLDEQCEIAECTFVDAGRVWQQAKAAADARVAKESLDAQVRTAIEEREAQERQDDDATVEEYIARTTQIESIEELESMREPLDEQIRKFLQRNDYRGANVARRELLAVQTQEISLQTQEIALERKRSARSRRFSSVALFFAIIGIAFGLTAATFPSVLVTARREAVSAVHVVESMVNKTPSSAPTAVPK
ncbi:MAG TPA: hypothetical protein VK782_04735 [Candidatus Sulfotelmatobacter sp.]|jgi:hypothetical protein|nr:hypothetical protein [Candidatus Sulfotelmatobacter sp.]